MADGLGWLVGDELGTVDGVTLVVGVGLAVDAVVPRAVGLNEGSGLLTGVAVFAFSCVADAV